MDRMMANSTADKLILYLRSRDEAKAKLEELDSEHPAWSTVGLMLDAVEREVDNLLIESAIRVDRLGRLAKDLAKLAEGKA